MNLRFTLVGAYFPEPRPLEQRRLDVDVRVLPGSLRLGPARMDLTAIVHAVGLATEASATGHVVAVSPGVTFTLEFSADDDRPVALSFTLSSLARMTIRSLTELPGCLVERDTGRSLGSVRLRFDARRALGL